MLRNYIHPQEREAANRQISRLMFEGLLLGGSGLGVLALIFEIAADAFSVAAYQTLLAIHGAEGYHTIAIWAFIVLSGLLFLGIVPAYQAGAYLRPNAGGSGPLVEAIGPPRLRWLSWIGTSLFFIDAVLTIIISSISAADVTMLILPELADYRILLAEIFAFFIMAVLVAIGPKRAVPLFLLGGGAFTIFTIVALTMVGAAAAGNPEWAFLTDGIVGRLEALGVVEHVVRAQEDVTALGSALFFQLFLRSMSSAMLGFSGYEVIPASGKHAARPKWKVINLALTLAALFLISTGVVQLYAARQWNIPATEGYSTLLIEYEIIAAQTLGSGIAPEDVVVTDADRLEAERVLQSQVAEQAVEDLQGVGGEVVGAPADPSPGASIDRVAYEIAFTRTLNQATTGRAGESFLVIAGSLLAIILLLAQGGGYVGGAAVAANAARLGRLPSFLLDDRLGIGVIWGISAILIPIIREVVVVEAYYAFGFVSAFAITSTTVFFVRHDALQERGITPDSPEARSLRFAGLRGMIASYIMLAVLITQKTDALIAIVIAGALLTFLQLYIANGSLRFALRPGLQPTPAPAVAGEAARQGYDAGIERAHDQARQRGVVHAVEDLIASGALAKFNVGPERIRRLVAHVYNIDPEFFADVAHAHPHDRIEEPNLQLQATYENAYNQRAQIARRIEDYSHFGIFMFIHNYHLNWVATEHGRDATIVQQAMLNILFPLTDHDTIWREFCAFEPEYLPEAIWQFSRQRYQWAKDQWPNLSDRITTIWTLQDFGLVPKDLDVRTVISVAGGKKYTLVKIHTHGVGAEKATVDQEDLLEDGEEAHEVKGVQNDGESV